LTPFFHSIINLAVPITLCVALENLNPQIIVPAEMVVAAIVVVGRG
jgi:hypothetical protein